MDWIIWGLQIGGAIGAVFVGLYLCIIALSMVALLFGCLISGFVLLADWLADRKMFCRPTGGEE